MFVLIHSPIVGPLTWELVADELRRRGFETLAPPLPAGETSGRPFWRQHAAAVVAALQPLPPGEKPVLVAHSGAGLLLPAVRDLLGRTVASYVFVDAGIPEDGRSRLELLGEDLGAQIEGEVRRQLAAGRRLPAWTEEELREEVPDAGLRRQLIAELRPQPKAFYEEPLPVFDGWPDAPAAYLQFSAAYDVPARRAVRSGWRHRRLQGGHFHMLVDPPAVAQALLELIA